MVCLLLFFLLLFTYSVPEELDPNIIRGKRAKRAKYPYIVSLQRRGHFCGGSILNEDSILTAAHCLEKDPSGVSVYIGNVDIRRQKRNSQFTFKVAKFIIHEKYKSLLDGYDLGIIKLKEKINFSKFGANVGRICLPEGPKDQPDTTKDCIVIGWGRNRKQRQQKFLNEAHFKIQSKKTCKRKGFKGYNPKRIYCALGERGKGRQCSGDSGGPILCRPKTGNSRWIQYGIVSFSGKPDCSSTPSFFTAVDKFTGWIKANI